jgi:GNAT superfamily N-acetyltransferase
MSALRGIWKNTFGSIGEEAFFRHFYNPELCIVVEYKSSLASVGYLVPFGEILCNLKSVPCAMIYSVATLPDCRGMGFGAAVTKELINLAHRLDYPAVVLCPHGDGLFDFYGKHTQLRDWFYIDEQIIKNVPVCNNAASLIKVSPERYCELREKYLKSITHIRHDLRIMEYQAMLCNELGGGLYTVDDFCAVVERQADGAVWIKELLSPIGVTGNISDTGPNHIDVLAAIAAKYPSSEYVFRYPVRTEKGCRFGMLALDNSEISRDLMQITSKPWYGMAFD